MASATHSASRLKGPRTAAHVRGTCTHLQVSAHTHTCMHACPATQSVGMCLFLHMYAQTHTHVRVFAHRCHACRYVPTCSPVRVSPAQRGVGGPGRCCGLAWMAVLAADQRCPVRPGAEARCMGLDVLLACSWVNGPVAAVDSREDLEGCRAIGDSKARHRVFRPVPSNVPLSACLCMIRLR